MNTTAAAGQELVVGIRRHWQVQGQGRGQEEQGQVGSGPDPV